MNERNCGLCIPCALGKYDECETVQELHPEISLEAGVTEIESLLIAERERAEKAEAERDEYLHIMAECRDAAGDWREHPEAMGDPYEVPAVISRLKQRAEAAEQRIKASQEQEPGACVYTNGSGESYLDFAPYNSYAEKLYKQPPIPPELSEVVRERDELRRKLAEQSNLTVDAIYAAWHGAGVDIAGGNWERFVEMLPTTT